MTKRLLTAAALLVLATATAEARIDCDRFGCRTVDATAYKRVAAYNASIVGGRPRECYIRHRGRLIKYCGCALSVKLFGRVIPHLNLAWNWPKFFPREPAPRADLVAARPGHVMLLMRHVDADVWQVYDPNSGGGLTRVHVRSVKGFVFVNPHAVRMAGKGNG